MEDCRCRLLLKKGDYFVVLKNDNCTAVVELDEKLCSDVMMKITMF